MDNRHWHFWQQRPLAIALVGLAGLIGTACSRASLEKAFSSDPQADQWNQSGAQPSEALPVGFPKDLRYPGAVFESPSESPATAPQSTDATGTETRWRTSDTADDVAAFYQQKLQASDWQGFQRTVVDDMTRLSAQRDALAISVQIPRSPTSDSTAASASRSAPLRFTVALQPLSDAATDTAAATSQPAVSTLQPATTFADLNETPEALQPYVDAVAQLAVLTPAGQTNEGQPTFAPLQATTRATFARWLVEANNRIYRDRPVRQIRLGTAERPAFSDVPKTHPEFAYIQGLAEAGYIPSVLSGDSSQTQFQPSAPLTRETLLLWKVPIDRQQILPTVAVDRVKQLWGFKDASQIAAIALSAVAADHQNNELANIRRMFGSTLLFQPKKPVTRAEAAAALWFIGTEGNSLSAQDLLRSEQQSAAQSSSATDSQKATSPKAAPSATP